MDVTFFATPADFRAWLAEHHDKAEELWVGYYKKGSGKPSITWPESVDEALCFGWIDGVRKRLDDESYVIRFTPRRRSSNWSAVNIRRVDELTEMGRMAPPGRKAFEERDRSKDTQYSYEPGLRQLDERHEAELRRNERAWRFFQAQPPSYQRAASWWVMSAKKDETQRRRLRALIEASEQGERLASLTGAAYGHNKLR